MTATIGLVGGRGYTGSELLKLIAGHPEMSLAFASSGSHAGEKIRSHCPGWRGDEPFIALNPENVSAHRADSWVLALPNGAAGKWAEAIGAAHPDAVILDLSADHRFSNSWTYGLPERYRQEIAGSRHIANPGCYATGMQLGLMPLLTRLTGTPTVFGVSGYSGAGKTPSPRNDPEHLADNLLPYRLAGHVHEREVSHHLGLEVRFMPHVASFFRGISLTIAAELDGPATAAELNALYSAYYEGEALVRVQDEIPEVVQVREAPDAVIGGFTVDDRDPRRVTLVSVLDNLSKGAATQAMQNLNLALGLKENMGILRGGLDD